MKILIAGDFAQRYRVGVAVREKRYSDLFEKIRPLVKQADYSIVNFEFPIIKDGAEPCPIKKCGPNLNGTIEAVEALKYAGFKCCTLANNHILDQGEQCCLDTKNALEKMGIDTVGAGYNIEDASQILYKKIGEETLAVINCAEHEFTIATDCTAGANPLNPIRQFYKIQEAKKSSNYVFVIVHGGHEHFQLPSPRMQETYRFFIDCGADAVFNHHQHCFSGYELYHGKPIYYGLGNFCFDDPKHREDNWNYGLFVCLNLSAGRIDIDNYPYIQCSESVSVNLLDGAEKSQFMAQFDKLSNIIADSDKLYNACIDWYNNNDADFRLAIEPYSNRVFKALFVRRMLPSCFGYRKKLFLENITACESHLDRFLYMLKKNRS